MCMTKFERTYDSNVVAFSSPKLEIRLEHITVAAYFCIDKRDFESGGALKRVLYL